MFVSAWLSVFYRAGTDCQSLPCRIFSSRLGLHQKSKRKNELVEINFFGIEKFIIRHLHADDAVIETLIWEIKNSIIKNKYIVLVFKQLWEYDL